MNYEMYNIIFFSIVELFPLPWLIYHLDEVTPSCNN